MSFPDKCHTSLWVVFLTDALLERISSPLQDPCVPESADSDYDKVTPQAEKIKKRHSIRLTCKLSVKTTVMTSTMISAIAPDQRLNRSLVFSSQQQDWNGILVHHYQNAPYLIETEVPALSNHWIQLMLREQPTRLIQRRDDRVHDSIVQTGDSIFMPAGQPSYWHCPEKSTCESILHIYLKPELIMQVAEASNLNGDRHQ